MSLHYKKAALIAKRTPEVLPYLQETVRFLIKNGLEFYVEQEFFPEIRVEKGRLVTEEECDLYLVLGGDGTFLSVVAAALKRDVPVAGFNLGSLGFLTELTREHLLENVRAVLENRLQVSNRKVLQLKLNGCSHYALNDIVVHSTDIARTIRLLADIDGKESIELKGDGIIIATPTGSTAYSLAAGGPIVSPEVNAIVINPICPHTLNLRPLVIPDSAMISVKLLPKTSSAALTIDGQMVIKMNESQVLEVMISEKMLRMFLSPELNYYQLLKEKLHWGT